LVTTGAGNDVVIGGSGSDTLDGGSGNGTLYGNKGTDYIVGGGGKTTEFGGKGNDTIVAGSGGGVSYGNLGDDVLIGGNGSDSMYGGKGNDTIKAGSGSELLSGDKGSNLLIGGSGNDTFVYNTPDHGGIDTITNFNAGNDKIRLMKAGFGGLAAQGSSFNSNELVVQANFDTNNPGSTANKVIYDSAKGLLYYNNNGTIQTLAVISTGLSLNASNFELF
jgi:Ca2+-binding RTX toxin-like protein